MQWGCLKWSNQNWTRLFFRCSLKLTKVIIFVYLAGTWNLTLLYSYCVVVLSIYNQRNIRQGPLILNYETDVFTAGIPLMRLNLDCCGFICASISGSPLPLSFMQCNICSLGSCAPLTFLWRLRPQSTTVGFSQGGEGGRWRDGPSPSCQNPSKQGRAKAPCVRTIQLNLTQCMLRSYLRETKYTLSYQRQWMSDWNSQFYGKCKHIYYAPPLQAVQIKMRVTKGKNKHCGVWLLKNLENTTRLDPEV